jgi:predicted DNA binding CopG/RHH family protein
MEEQMSTKEIPRTDSIQELAQFWDSHDLTDFADDLEEVSEPVFERETAVTIHLSSEEAEAVKRIARSKGIDSADLIREWVEESLTASS